MGRSETPLPSDRNGEESLEEPTENNSRASVEDVPKDGDNGRVCSFERFRGVDSKYNEQDGANP